MPRNIFLNVDKNGIGDAVIAAWIAEGSRDADPCLRLYCTGQRRELLELLGQQIEDRCPPACRSISQVYEQVELREQRGSVPRLQSRAQSLGITAEPVRPVATLTSETREKALRFIEDRRKKLPDRKPVVLVFPQIAWATREWPAAYWVELIWMLHNTGTANPVVLLEHNDPRYINTPFWAAGIRLTDVAALMLHADMVIGNDSGAVNLSGTLGVPTVALMGPTKPTIFAHSPETVCLQVTPDQMPCVGCHFGLPYRAACDQGCFALYELTPAYVHTRVQDILKGIER